MLEGADRGMLDIADAEENSSVTGNMLDITSVGDVLRGLPSPEGRAMCRDFAAFLEKWYALTRVPNWSSYLPSIFDRTSHNDNVSLGS